jgi:hypothetical protein
MKVKVDIKEAIKIIVKKRISLIAGGLNFIFTQNKNESDIRISFDPSDGCWSYVGIESKDFKNEPTMNFGWFDVATVIHEFGHALGMIHEHQNPRDNKIKWNEKAVISWAKNTQGWDENTTRSNIIDAPNEQINGSSYDPESIMLYFFPGSLTLNNKGTEENLRLSPNDVIFLHKNYPGKKTPNDIYIEMYNENIENAIKLQKKSNNNNNSKLYIGIFISIIIISIILLFIKF